MVAPPKKQLLLLLFCISAIFVFFSYHHSSLPTSSNPTFTQSFQINSRHVPNFTLIIKVLTFNRLSSLSRCLHSLAAANYLNDAVHLHIFIDHFVNKSSDADKLLEESRQILRFVDRFDWRFGEKLVHYRTGNVGLQAQWLEAWWPTSDNEFAFVVEDDLEISPLFYRFLRNLIIHYYYGPSFNYTESIYGASLQRPRFVPGKHGNKIHLDSKTNLFLYQLVGTWGQLLFPRPWKEFRLWYDEHKAKSIKPLLEGMVTTGWYKKMGERIWTPWFIKFIHSRGYFNIYTNFENERALSVSHRDAGVNYGKSVGPDSQLLLDESSLDKIQPLSKLDWYDFCFRQVFPGRVLRNLDELGSVLLSVQKQETVILLSLFGAVEAVLRNLICHFERLNIRNYIFVGPQSDSLFDLARRGHPVVDADRFLSNINSKAYKSLRLQKEALAKAYIIKKCLEYKYNTWVMDANLVLTNSDMLSDSIHDTNFDIFYGGESLELLFVRRSSSVLNVWTDDCIHKVVTMAEPTNGRNFADIVANILLNHKGAGIKIKRFEKSNGFLQIGDKDPNRSSPVGEEKKKMVYWSPDIESSSVKRLLEELSMWIIDDDLACTSVVCHPS